MATLAQFALFACVATSMYGQLSTTQIEKHAEAAQEAQARQDFKTAITEYEILSRQMPRNAELMSNLGVALYFDHQLPESIAVFRKATVLKPTLEAPHLFIGLASYHLSNPDGAAKELEEAVHLNPGDPLAHTWLGYAYGAQSRPDAALVEFQAAAKLQPENVDLSYALGQTYLEIGRIRTKELLSVAPTGGRVWQLAGEQFEMSGDHEKSAAAFAEAHRLRPDLPVSAEAKVIPDGSGNAEDRLYRQAHDAEQSANEAFQHVLQAAPDSARAHEIMADAYTAQQQWDQALVEYRQVLQADPTLPGIHGQISSNLMIKGEFAQALEECKAEAKIQPASAKVQTDIGRILLAMGKNSDATIALKRALELDRPPAEAYLLLGKAELREGNGNEAVRLLQHYVGSRPEDSAGYNALSKAYHATGDVDQMNRAIALYQKTSKDAKERNMAETELSRLSEQERPAKAKELEDSSNSTLVQR